MFSENCHALRENAWNNASLTETAGRCKPWLDVDGHRRQTVQRLLHGAPHDAEALAERFGLCVVALDLDRHDLACERGDGVLDLRLVDRKRAIGCGRDGALIEQKVQLNGDAAAVRLVDP